MGRRKQQQKLRVWMNGLPVGCWEIGRAGDRLAYSDDWVGHPQGRPLSLSLPFLPGNTPHQGAAVAAFFDNLLPDSETIRRRLAQRHRLAEASPFQLLSALGRDCVGAIQLLPEDETPQDLRTIRGETLDETGIARLLRQAVAVEPLGLREDDADLRLSIAGAQEKTALLRHADRWLLPQGSTPTTHIFKLPLGLVGGMQADMRSSVENEWLCSRLVAGFGLPVANCDIARFEEQKVLVVERFDRRLATDGGWILRQPQEDMCQATATPPHLKYQADGGPGIARILDILTGSQARERDRMNFFRTQLVFWLLAATDGHAKNFSLFHLPGGQYQATPLYDILSAHPIIGTGRGQIAPQKVKLAMAVRGGSNHYLVERIRYGHWLSQARQAGLAPADAARWMDELMEQTGEVVKTVAKALPADFPEDVADSIFQGMLRQRDKLAMGKLAGDE
ncbi:type II toxin-antitoxin system HipA family toxin [Chromobacterium subtsugae]|uniref:type II toxin-antitoxin system HipA family toxin n=1 Tax=Chromobacterium subtsugae TaxID=251747 RepID=UPI00064120A2|nr:type II toxin-antitoxin system HipA family toxin [Chromobacterium subtsugae]